MAKTEKKCNYCGKVFLAENKEINRGNAKYCSLSCKQKHYRAQQKVDNTKDMKYYYKIFEYIPCELCG